MNRITFFLTITVLLFGQCAQAQKNQYIDPDLPGLKGQKFAPDLVSLPDRHEFGAVFSPDGREFFFAYVEKGKNTIMAMYYEDGVWSAADTVLHDETYGFNDPFLSPDGNRLFYISNFKEGQKVSADDIDIWYSERLADGRSWSAPINAGPNINSEKNEYYISFSAETTLYFATNAYTNRSGDFDIYRSAYRNGVFQPAEKLGPGVNTRDYEADVFVAPDESYLVFASSREDGQGMGDLYISFNKNGTWSKAQNLGEAVNTRGHELCPYVTPDGKYLIYTSNADIYWVNTEIFDSFK